MRRHPICKTEKETQMYRTVFWTLWEKARVGCFKRTASKHVYHLGWNRSPAQVGCMKQVLGPGALGRPRGSGWRGRWEGGSGWGTHVNPWLIHFNVWQNPLELKKREREKTHPNLVFFTCRFCIFDSWLLQYSCLGNLMDTGTRGITVHCVVRVEHNLVTKTPPACEIHTHTHTHTYIYIYIYIYIYTHTHTTWSRKHLLSLVLWRKQWTR